MTKKRTGRERENPLRPIGDITERKRTEQALRDSEEQWCSLVENIPDIIMTLDRDGTILFINRTPPGFTVEATIGAIVYDYVPPEHHDTLRGSLEGVFETGDGHDYEIVAPGPFGRSSWYFNRIGPIVRDGRVVAAALIATDITERRRSEEALRESEERFRHLVEEVNDLIYEVDERGQVTYVSPAVEQILGYSPSEMIGRPFTDFLRSKDLPAVVESFREALTRDTGPVEYGVVSKSGEIRWLRNLGRPIRDGDRVVGFRGVQTDITDRRRAEEELRESEERYRHLVENVNEAIYELDAGGRMTYISPVVEEVGGYSPSEIVGRPFADFLHPDDLSGAVENFQRAVSGHPTPNEYRLLSKTGEVLWARSFGRPIFDGDRVVGVRGVLTDITQRKLADEALRESEERWRSLAENAPDIIMTVDADGTILFANRVVPGLAVESVIGTSLDDYLPPEHRDRQRRALGRVFETGEPQSYEIAGTGPHGSTSWYFSRIGPVARGDKVVAAILITTDITEERRAEEELRQSEERYRTLVEAAPDVIYSLSMDGTITSLNSAFESLSGWSRDDWLGKHFAPIIHPDDLPAVMKDFRLVLQGKVPPVGEYRMLTESGEYVMVETVPRPLIVDGEVVGTLGIARDMTPRKEMEEMLQKVREEVESKVERQMPRGNPYGFSFREFTVLHLVTAGQSDREIGITLGISSVTAQKHVEHLRAKMKAATRIEAGVRALREGLLG